MFPFKVQLFQGCKSEIESINTKSVVQHVIRYQVLLATYYKADTKYCCCHATCLSGHIVYFTKHTHTHTTVFIQYQVLLAAYYKADTKYCCCHATCLSGHIVDFTTHTHQPFVYNTKCCWRHVTRRFELSTVCKSFKIFK
jgi:peroxiredoxin